MNLRTDRPFRKSWRAAAVLTALMFASSPALAGELEARVDRDAVTAGESLQLLLRYRGGEPSGAPDLSALERDFELLDVRQSQRTSIVNGRVDQSFDWIVTLEPRSKGEFEIPSVSLGRDASQPLTVRVGDAPAGASAPSAAAFLEVEVDDARPYVQGKVTLTARLFLDDSVRGGSLSDPASDGALVQRLGEDVSYRTRRDGRDLQVIERAYALFPQESGVLEISPLRFEGTQRSDERGERRSPFGSPFGRDPFDDLFGGSMMGGSPFGSSMFDELLGGGGRPIRARSGRVTLDVQARPDSATGSWWLPARSVELIERFEQGPPVFRVGEPVKRTVAVQAVGLSGAQMPALELPEIAGVRQYAGESVDDTFVADEETVAVKLQEVTLIPSRAGRTVLPAIELEWWDVAADERRVAAIPAREIDVLDAAGGVVVAPIEPPLQPAERDASSSVAAPPAEARARPWITLSGAALIVALTALFVARRRRRTDKTVSAVEPVPARRAVEAALRRACAADDARAASNALSDLGRALFPNAPPAAASALAERLASDELRARVAELDRARFAATGGPWSGAELWRAWRAAARASEPDAKVRRAVLPDLYPAVG